jgi:tetratricopeptide (TPR) repeat protein
VRETGRVVQFVLAILLGTICEPGAAVAQQMSDEGAVQEAQPVDMTDGKAVEQRADLYMVRKYYPEAVELYLKLTTLEPRNPLHYNKLGIAYHQLQQFGAAKKAYRKALQLRPQYPEAINNLAAVEYAEKNYRGAILTYLKALELSPGDPVVYSNLGTAYFAYEKFEYAMDSYRFALLRDPRIFERTGRSGNIVQQRDIKNVGAFNFYLAKTYATLGNVEQTLLYLIKAWEEGYPDIRKEMGDPVFAFLAEEPQFLEWVARMDAKEREAASTP